MIAGLAGTYMSQGAAGRFNEGLTAGKDLTGSPPRPIIEAGAAHLPEDRQRHGLVLSYTAADNIVLCDYYQPRFSRGAVIQEKQVDTNARKLIKEYDVRTPSPYVSASKLSGGNQQKMIVARELSRPVKLVIDSQPTRSLDVGSIEYIHKEIVAMRDRCVAGLLILLNWMKSFRYPTVLW